MTSQCLTTRGIGITIIGWEIVLCTVWTEPHIFQAVPCHLAVHPLEETNLGLKVNVV